MGSKTLVKRSSMPVTLETLLKRVDEDCVLRWAKDLRPTTASRYLYYMLKYLEWVKAKGYFNSAAEMLEDARNGDLQQHLNILLEWVQSSKTGHSDRRNRLQSVRNFYEYHRIPLPRLTRWERERALRPSEMDKLRSTMMKAMTVEEFRRIAMELQQPYKAALMTCFQAAFGASEYDWFNKHVWHFVINKLDDPEPVQIPMVRSKVSRLDVKNYYTFIGKDAKALIKEWLEMRPNCDCDTLFVTYNRIKRKYVPLNSKLLANMLTQTAKKLKIVEPNPTNRYHVHLHELRDLFRSLCSLKGVSVVAAEWFMGHLIDKYNYDKSPEYDVDWFRNEYKKVEPALNILSGGDIEAVKEEVKAEFSSAIEALAVENAELKRRLEKLERVLQRLMVKEE